MKSKIDHYVEKIAELVSVRKWIVMIFFIATPLSFTAVGRYFTGKDFFTDFGDYVEIGFEMVVLGVIGTYICRLIANKAQMIRTLHESQERYRQLFEIAPDPMIVHRKGKILLTNKAAAKAFGLKDPKNVQSRSLFEFTPSNVEAILRERIDTVEKKQESVPPIEIQFRRSDNQDLYIEARSVPTSYEGHDAVLTVGRNVTERKAAEKGPVRKRKTLP